MVWLLSVVHLSFFLFCDLNVYCYVVWVVVFGVIVMWRCYLCLLVGRLVLVWGFWIVGLLLGFICMFYGVCD